MTTDQRQPCPGLTTPKGICGIPPDKEHIIQIHPTADMFPMLNTDELHDLAESIKTEGQHEGIVLTADGVLLDGRNRLAACEIAGVEPRFATYTGSDPKGLILAHNLRRRHISKGQQAMIVAMARSFSEHSLRHHAKLHSISLTRLSNAATVLKHHPHLAEQVRVGSLSLDAAYSTVREHLARAAEIKAQHDRLREHAPDLAEQVSGACSPSTTPSRHSTSGSTKNSSGSPWTPRTLSAAPTAIPPRPWLSSSSGETSTGSRLTSAPNSSASTGGTPSNKHSRLSW
ncbi:ParB/RepB/Spo0J family partition protein [Streptomyces cellulosae]